MDHSLLLKTSDGGYHLHEVVLEYLQLDIRVDDDNNLALATSRQARYLARPEALPGCLKDEEDTGGALYPLVSMWNALVELNPGVDVLEYYTESLADFADPGRWRVWKDAGNLLQLLVSGVC